MEMSGSGTKSPRWPWIAAVFLGLGLFEATQTVFVMRAEGMHHVWGYLFAVLLLSWLPWVVVVPLVLRLGRRYPPLRLRPVLTWLVHLVTCGGAGLFSSAWTAWLEYLLNPWAVTPAPGPFAQLWLQKFVNGLLSFAILYASILALSYLFDSRERLARQETETARLNEQLSRAQLDALRRQIEPHFLFNTLNAIAGLVRERRNDAAVNMIVALSDFLRRVVQNSTSQQAPLGEEVENLQRYLEIQKARFAERMQVYVDVPSELCSAQVPALILQPMVENAVKHGIAQRAQGGAIRITAARRNGMLTLRVYNDGPQLTAEWDSIAAGTGISNVRTRLRTLYGDAFELTLRNHGPNGVEASVSVPWKEV